MLHCIRRCDLELAGVVVSPYASGLASLVEDEQELGAACVDIGAGATGVSIFVRRQMIYADAVRMGGVHVTSDICQGLQVSMQDAERLKTMHGGLIATGLDDRDMIELPSILGDWDHDRRQISRSELIGVMRPRVEEILEEVRARLDASGFEYLPCQRIVLTGGSAQIPGLEIGRARSPRPAVPRSASRSGCRACRSRRPAPPSRPRSGSRCTSRIRRTNAGTSRCPPTARARGGWPARSGGSRKTGKLVARTRRYTTMWWETHNILRVVTRNSA